MDEHPLRRWLRVTGTPVSRFAAALGVSREAVYVWLDGEGAPTLARALEIERTTGGAVRPEHFAPKSGRATA